MPSLGLRFLLAGMEHASRLPRESHHRRVVMSWIALIMFIHKIVYQFANSKKSSNAKSRIFVKTAWQFVTQYQRWKKSRLSSRWWIFPITIHSWLSSPHMAQYIQISESIFSRIVSKQETREIFTALGCLYFITFLPPETTCALAPYCGDCCSQKHISPTRRKTFEFTNNSSTGVCRWQNLWTGLYIGTMADINL